MDREVSFGSSGAEHRLVPVKPAQDPEDLGWIAMLAELEVREHRFGAGHEADPDTLFQPLRGKDGVSFRQTAGEEMHVVLGTLET